MSSKKIISNQMTHTPLPPPHNPPRQSQFYNNWGLVLKHGTPECRNAGTPERRNTKTRNAF